MIRTNSLRPAAMGCVVILAAASVASAGIVTTPLSNSGWSATVVDDASVSFAVDNADPLGDGYLVIQISKDFTEPRVDGIYPAKLIDFVQTDPNAVSKIIINDEVITNQTGTSWTDFHWTILDSGDAWFNVPESAGWTTDPFVNQTYSTVPVGLFGGDPNKANNLDVDGGVLPDFGASFFPGGSADPNDHLVIDINVTGTTSFTLKEFPTPEPATLGLLAIGGLAIVRRRRR